jgi:hypothetical protein
VCLGESFLRKFVYALALLICGPAFAQEISVPFGQGGSRTTYGNIVTHQVILDARMYVSIPIEKAGTVAVEGLTETFDGIHCVDPDPDRHAWGWTYDKFKALFEADGGFVAKGEPVQITDGFLPGSSTRGILTAVLIDTEQYALSGRPPIPGINNVDMSRSKWVEFKGIANATPGITVAAVGKGGALKFAGTKGQLVLFMNDRVNAGAYAAHQGSVCARATVTP